MESIEDEQALFYDFLCIGGGVAAGYWAQELVSKLGISEQTEHKPRIGIVSPYPKRLAPYERPALSKACLDPEKKGLRNFLEMPELDDGSHVEEDPSPPAQTFPWTTLGTGGKAHGSDWYDALGIEILYQTTAINLDLDKKIVTVEEEINGAAAKAYEVEFNQVLVATGCRARRLGAGASLGLDAADGVFRPGRCHPQLEVRDGLGYAPKTAGAFGFGSVHALRDLGDAVELGAAMARVESDSQETCRDPAVVVGGGFVGFEAACALAGHCPDHGVTLVLSQDHIFPGFFNEEMANFYETEMVRKGIRFARNYKVERLWPTDETGEFVTLDGPGMALGPTLPRWFGRCPAEFHPCRGVVLAHTETGAEARLAARYVVAGVGGRPNTELAQKAGLALSPDTGGIIVDGQMRTAHPSGCVFAAGDVAHFPNACRGDDGNDDAAAAGRDEHVAAARGTAVQAARAMAAAAAAGGGGGGAGREEGAEAPAAGAAAAAGGGGGEAGGQEEGEGPYARVPHCYSRALSFSWKFYGAPEGEIVVLGLGEAARTGRFGAFWVGEDGRINGGFLEGGTEEENRVLEGVARDRVDVRTVKMLRRQKLEDFLADPRRLSPHDLAPGDFAAEASPHIVHEVFVEAASGNPPCPNTGGPQVKTEKLEEVMLELGADWNESELKTAIKSMDPLQTGLVSYQVFSNWWMN